MFEYEKKIECTPISESENPEPASVSLSNNDDISGYPLINQECCNQPSSNETEHYSIEEEKKKRLSPLDGGYGWFIVFSSFIMHAIIGGLERSDGIFFLQFQEKFQQSAQMTAWPVAIAGSLRLLVGPLAAAICEQYSVRTCCMIGSLLQFIGLMMTSLNPSFYFLFISHALIQGFGRGLLYTPSIIIVNKYFDKKRSVSLGIATSGAGVGSFILVPLVQFLFDFYGFMGAILILSAVSLNFSLVSTMLNRPLSLHYKFIQSDMLRVKSVQSSSPGRPRLSNSRSNPPKAPQSYRESCRDCISSIVKICLPKEDNYGAPQGSTKIFHLYLLKNVPFLLFCLSIMLFTATFKSVFTFIPALVKSKGYTDSEAAMIVSIIGAADTIGRLGSGCLFDLGFLRPCRAFIYNVWVFVLAIICFVLPFLNSYFAICFVVSLYGLFFGAYISQKAVVIVDILGADNIAISFGMLICFQGLGSTFGPPLSGVFKDEFGSFTYAFFFGGASMGFAGVIMIFSNLFLKCQPYKRDNERGTLDLK